MLNPEERIPFACRSCWDHRVVWTGHREIPCPLCSTWDADRRREELRADTARRAVKPGIDQMDLTPEEFERYLALKRTRPDANNITVLAWVEGQRYRPEEDPEFLGLVERRLAKWRDGRETEGPEPSRPMETNRARREERAMTTRES